MRNTRAVSKYSRRLRGGREADELREGGEGWNGTRKGVHTGTKNIKPGTALVYDPPRENLP